MKLLKRGLSDRQQIEQIEMSDRSIVKKSLGRSSLHFTLITDKSSAFGDRYDCCS